MSCLHCHAVPRLAAPRRACLGLAHPCHAGTRHALPCLPRLPSHDSPIQASPRLARGASPCDAIVAAPCRAIPRRALPRLRFLAWPRRAATCLASPALPIPASPRLDTPCIDGPGLACLETIIKPHTPPQSLSPAAAQRHGTARTSGPGTCEADSLRRPTSREPPPVPPTRFRAGQGPIPPASPSPPAAVPAPENRRQSNPGRRQHARSLG